MKNHSVVITDGDMQRLSSLTEGSQHSSFRDQQQLDRLDHVLQTAEVRPLHRTPKNIVRLTSRVQVRDIHTGRKDFFTIVFPDEANAAQGLISALAPIGIALIGRRRGDIVDANAPGGIRRLRILHVRQSPGSSAKDKLPFGQPMMARNFFGGDPVAA